MKNSQRTILFGLMIALLAGAVLLTSRGTASEDAQNSAQPAPVEDDMHEFMEYVFEPPYKRLKAGLAKAPANRSAWKGLKSDSLILAEAANLLLHRAPEEDGPAWNKNAQSVRVAGGELYRAAKKRDFDLTKKSFATMLKKCNQCHDQFADGEHQLAP